MKKVTLIICLFLLAGNVHAYYVECNGGKLLSYTGEKQFVSCKKTGKYIEVTGDCNEKGKREGEAKGYQVSCNIQRQWAKQTQEELLKKTDEEVQAQARSEEGIILIKTNNPKNDVILKIKRGE